MAAYPDDAYPVAGLRSGAQSSIASQQRPSSSSSGGRRAYHHRTSESSSSFCLGDHDDLLEGLSPQGRKSLIMAETAAMIGDHINASAVYGGGGDGRGGGDESWSNTISSTDSQWSMASSLSFPDSSFSASAAADFAGKMDLSSASILDDQHQHNLHNSFPAAPPKKRGQHHRRHRRSPNMAMGSQDFFDKVLKDI
eukprot:CAMPEP_0113467088 /NCGR_PEP_ID=MMETSP0014_2-20120614/14625_1 /TAXON_ID=2857 /ORGANISM="Nitzschia sp." /LENGTH=195 /DNA_ID=CAMNT_0000359367 /DNA_START=200 /DNA_END=787 /DNA_ORIENTATION=- /assembly_acc=CAM_ASM_000159